MSNIDNIGDDNQYDMSEEYKQQLLYESSTTVGGELRVHDPRNEAMLEEEAIRNQRLAKEILSIDELNDDPSASDV